MVHRKEMMETKTKIRKNLKELRKEVIKIQKSQKNEKQILKSQIITSFDEFTETFIGTTKKKIKEISLNIEKCEEETVRMKNQRLRESEIQKHVEAQQKWAEIYKRDTTSLKTQLAQVFPSFFFPFVLFSYACKKTSGESCRIRE